MGTVIAWSARDLAAATTTSFPDGVVVARYERKQVEAAPPPARKRTERHRTPYTSTRYEPPTLPDVFRPPKPSPRQGHDEVRQGVACV